MLRIRLTRVGKKKQPHYRIVIAESKKAVQAKFVTIIGWYDPKTKDLKIEETQLKGWLDKGAQPTNTVAKLLKANGFKLPEWVVIEIKNKKKKSTEDTPVPKKSEEVVAEEVKGEVADAPEAVAEEAEVKEDSEATVEEVVEDPKPESKEKKK